MTPVNRVFHSTRLLACAHVLLAFAGVTSFALSAAAESNDDADPISDDEDKMPPPGYLPGHQQREGIGLSPHVPGMQSALPGGLTPSFGAPLRPAEGAKFDFHGYAQAGGRVSFGKRPSATDEQHDTAWHGDPVVPRGNVFENTNTIPYTWAELRFSYSLPQVQATVSIGAWSLSQSMSAANSYMPNAQYWIRDAYMTYTPKGLGKVKLSWTLGVYEERYGAMAEYSNGAYGAPLVASLPGVGETLSVSVPLVQDWKLELEHGLKTTLSRAPVDIPTGPANNWQKPWEGQTIASHGHLGLNYKDTVRPTFHIVQALASDDQADQVPLGSLRVGYAGYSGEGPNTNESAALDHADGSLRVVAADVRLALKRFGHFYGGVSHTSLEHARSLNNVVQVLYAGGGRDLMDRYIGRNNRDGRGTLLVAGGQYDISLGELLRYPDEFWGEGPDLKLSLFGMYAHITSEDPARDGEDKYKFGAEGTYSMLPWLAGALRLDRAVPYAHAAKEPIYKGQNDNSYSVVTLKAVFRSDWQAREALTLQYSRYFYRSNFHLVGLNAGGQISTQSSEPDQNVLALFGTLWW
ncbi:MAG: hypothetical protein QM756_45270 [Polyangiaceae bacterium]